MVKRKSKRKSIKNPLSDNSAWIKSYDDLVEKHTIVKFKNGWVEGKLKIIKNIFNDSGIEFLISHKNITYFHFDPDDIDEIEFKNNNTYIKLKYIPLKGY